MRPTRIAIWSGPRNISTALMRSWEARGDCAVIDEPLYAHFLEATGAQRPDRDATLAAQETDWRKVVDHLLGPSPEPDKPLWYQKHMPHHLTSEMREAGIAWVAELRNAMLIREPREMIISFAKVIPSPTAEDMGITQQANLFHDITQLTGKPPPVILARDVLKDPPSMLRKLCEALDVPYTDNMLEWPSGKRPTDGPWAPWWYANVESSTGFTPFTERNEPLPDHLEPVLEQCEQAFAELLDSKLTP